MATFEATRGQRVQHHFEVLEIDLPVITGACTLGSSSGFGTPLTCDQAWVNNAANDGYKTYRFTNCNAPLLPGEYWRCISAISENVTELKPSKGLSSRGSLNITFQDFTKQDPNPTAPGVTDDVKIQGTFFGKLAARQIFENKTARLKLYRVEADGTIDLVNGAETRHYIANTLSLGSNGEWKLECKDVLSVANLDDKSWPIPANNEGIVRLDTNQSATKIPVDAIIDYAALVPAGGVFYIRIGDEFLKVDSVEDNQGPAAKLVIANRGSNIVAPISGELLTRTEKADHKAGDEIFICEVSDNEAIDLLIARVLTDSEVDATLIANSIPAWAVEVADWHTTNKINTLHSESEKVNKVLNRILTGFLMDLWFSTTENLIKLSAISVWKESQAILTEGKEINAYSIKKTANEDIRASRALIVYDKQNLGDNDDTKSYKKASQFTDDTIIGADLYSKHKDKIFDNNHLLGKSAADLLVQRYVSRFKFTPFTRSFTGDERYLTYNTGDVVDLITTIDQGADGLPSPNIRGQILKIKPKYTKEGRTYDIKAMTYEAAFNDGTEFVITNAGLGFSLYAYAGNPAFSGEWNFIFKGSALGIVAGPFPAGSKVNIILVEDSAGNPFDAQAKGGRGGKGESIEYDSESGNFFFTQPTNGTSGAIVYDAQGVDSDIYFSGNTSAISAAYPVANGYMRAPSGGAGGFDKTGTTPNYTSGNGGLGGDGSAAGAGGAAGDANPSSQVNQGSAGANGQIDGSGSGWGLAGANNDAVGGAAGSGIIDGLNAAGVAPTVNLFGATGRYINGNGDH